jgi:hypothetical protein
VNAFAADNSLREAELLGIFVGAVNDLAAAEEFLPVLFYATVHLRQALILQLLIINRMVLALIYQEETLRCLMQWLKLTGIWLNAPMKQKVLWLRKEIVESWS